MDLTPTNDKPKLNTMDLTQILNISTKHWNVKTIWATITLHGYYKLRYFTSGLKGIYHGYTWKDRPERTKLLHLKATEGSLKQSLLDNSSFNFHNFY